MTRAEYAAYEENVARFMARESLVTISISEGGPHFSWRSCECCGSFFPGDRYPAGGYNLEEDMIFEYEVCTDCLYYLTYGQLDDLTMMTMEEET